MVRKASVHLWNLDLRHVAVRTFFCANRASRSRMIFRRPGTRRIYMASQALRIIDGRLCRKWLVRIVAGNAGKSLVPSAPTLAAHEAIRLHPDVGDSPGARELDVHPCAMAGAAKIDTVTGTESTGIENEFPAFLVAVTIVRLVEFHREHMVQARCVAGFAGHA